MSREVAGIANNCTRFLCGHRPYSVRQRMLDIAASPLSEMRNDGYGREGYLAEFEKEVAGILGKEAALFMPSGTMAQPIALRIWSDRSGVRQVAFHPTCHLQIHEHMGYQELHGLEGLLLGEADRLFTLDDFLSLDRPVSTLLIELPQREIGGQLPTWEELMAICDAANASGARLHMDGARLWECAPFYGRCYAEISASFDSVYVSCYKILNGLPGAVLAGPQDFVDEAKIWQRRHGGNLQQQSPSAIAAKLGMETHLPQIGEYVSKAQEVAGILCSFDGVRVVPEHPPTNMTHVYLPGAPERWNEAALQVAEEDRVWLFHGLRDAGDGSTKAELYFGDASLEMGAEEIRRLFMKLIDLAGSGSD